MRLRDIFSSWQGEGILAQTLDEFLAMIDSSRWMYQEGNTALWKGGEVAEVKERIRERDIGINKAERSIRKKIVQHLAINPTGDVNYCLVLMSVVKDAERLGDYCKNIIEVAENYDPSKDRNDEVTRLEKIRDGIDALYNEVGPAFKNSDEAVAGRLITDERDLAKQCDEVIEAIFKESNLSIPQAATYALLARYYKRVAAHLGNIATSVVMPIHKMDYYDEDYMGKRKEEGQ